MTRPTRFSRLVRLALMSTLVAAGVLVGVASPAAAHTPTVSATCSTLSVSLQSYVSSAEKPRPNKVTVSIDSATAASEWFGSSFARDFSLGDSAKAHTWRVVVDAVDNGYDRTFDGTSTPCTPPAVKDASATLHTTPATCTAGGTLVLDSVVNATWSTPTATQGPATYSVTATATRGHLFDDGTGKRVFTGSLPGALDASSPTCASAPVVVPPRNPPRPPVKVTPPKPAVLQASSIVETVDCETNMLTTVTTKTSTDWVLNAAGTAWVPGVPTESSTTTRRPLPPESCPEVGSVGGGGSGGGGSGGGQSPVLASPASLSDAAAEAPEVDALAHAGNDILLAVGIAGALLLIGGLLLTRRRRPVEPSTNG